MESYTIQDLWSDYIKWILYKIPVLESGRARLKPRLKLRFGLSLLCRRSICCRSITNATTTATATAWKIKVKSNNVLTDKFYCFPNWEMDRVAGYSWYGDHTGKHEKEQRREVNDSMNKRHKFQSWGLPMRLFHPCLCTQTQSNLTLKNGDYPQITVKPMGAADLESDYSEKSGDI